MTTETGKRLLKDWRDEMHAFEQSAFDIDVEL